MKTVLAWVCDVNSPFDARPHYMSHDSWWWQLACDKDDHRRPVLIWGWRRVRAVIRRNDNKCEQCWLLYFCNNFNFSRLMIAVLAHFIAFFLSTSQSLLCFTQTPRIFWPRFPSKLTEVFVAPNWLQYAQTENASFLQQPKKVWETKKCFARGISQSRRARRNV